MSEDSGDSGVWVFKNGIVQLPENPKGEMNTEKTKQKVLFHLPSNKVITSYPVLDRHLCALGWERYYNNNDRTLIQYNKSSTTHLISLPAHFYRISSVHMDDIVLKNPNMFEVRDV